MKKLSLKSLGISLIYKPLKDGLGYFDEKTAEVAINSNLSKVEQDIILIHEFLHATATALKSMGIIKKAPDHDFITNCSTQMLVLFYLSGKWNGLTDKDIKIIIQ